MPTTRYEDAAFKVGAIQARTDAASGAVIDVDGEELRLYADLLTEGVLRSDDLLVTTVGGMGVAITAPSAGSAIACVGGDDPGQGRYLVRQELQQVTITIDAADPVQDRVDSIWLVVTDAGYDTVGPSLPRYAVRKGDAGGGTPGADAAWKAAMRLANVAVGAGVSTINLGDLEDTRTRATLVAAVDVEQAGGTPKSDFDTHVGATNPHGTTFASLPDAPATLPPDPHAHAGSDITSGTISQARLPKASTSQQGIVQLVNNVTSTDTTKAPTANALKNANDNALDAQATIDAHKTHGGYEYAANPTANRTITVSTSAPSGGSNGDVWLQT